MSTENTVDKVKLISELKEIHSELFQVYKKLFDFKYNHDEEFKLFIDKEHEENGVGIKEKKAWNDNFCHRASYTLLNKILFVRICEDKGFMRNTEDYIAGEVKDPHIGEKLSKVGLQKWGRLITNYTLGELIKFAFNDMKQSYSNIVLYKEDKYEILNPKDEEFNLKYIDGDKDTKDLVLDFENVLNNIIEKLDTNNFNFKYTDGNILGDVYEKFMNRETRKAIGQFYTPEFVIEYILKNTVEENDVIENPFVTVADISCGSGHFLIMAYDILREKFLSNLKALKERYAEESYTIKKDGKQIQLSGGEYWVKENVHYHILKNCIYGADIDSFAVQLTTINLLLKDLDNFTDELNIIECDSLVKWERDYDWKGLKEQLEEEFETVVTTQPNLFGDEQRTEIKQRKEKFGLKSFVMSQEDKELNREEAEGKIRLYEFWNKKFDYIIGNPPYIEFKKLRSEFKQYYNANYNSASGKYDIYVVFIERAINLLTESGEVGYICPTMFMKRDYGRNIKEYIINNINLMNILDFSDKQVFSDATTYTGIFLFNKKEKECFNYTKLIKDFNIDELQGYKYEDIVKNLLLHAETNVIAKESVEKNWEFVLLDSNNFLKLIEDNKSTTLEKITSKVFQGISSGKDEVFYLTDKDIKKNKLEGDLIYKLCKGKDADEYYQQELKYNVLYPYTVDNSHKQSVIKEEILKNKYNNVYNYLINNKKNLSGREYFESSSKLWYELWCERDKESFIDEKILVPEIASKNKFYYDAKSSFFNTKIYGIVLNEENVRNIGYYCLLGYLNSNIVNYYYKKITVPKAGGYFVYKTQFLNRIPIPHFDEQSKSIISTCAFKIQENLEKINKPFVVDKIVNGKEEILKQYVAYLNEKGALLRENELNNISINNACYKLFGFSISQIEVIEKTQEISKRDSVEYKLVLSNQYKPLDNNQARDLINDLKQLINPDEFIYLHSANGLNMSISEIAKKYNYENSTISSLREFYAKSINENDQWKFYNLTELYQAINVELKNECIKLFEKRDSTANINQIVLLLQGSLGKLDQFIEILRIENSNKKSIDIIKYAIESDIYTWNAYRKDKSQDKISKTFIKYYDSYYYGLAEWSDEIHKQYFMDAIDEYTVNSPNEKKAKDVLKLFNELDIEDKEDYVDIIEDKIKNAFS